MKTTVIRRKGQSALVEYMDGETPRRAWLPGALVAEDGETEDPSLGIPDGVDWASFLNAQTALTVDGVDYTSKIAALLEINLKRAGVWYMDDVLLHPHRLQVALNETMTGFMKQLIAAAKKESKR